MKRKQLFILLAMFLGIVLMLYAEFRLLETRRVHRESDAAYAALTAQVRAAEREEEKLSEEEGTGIPALNIDFVRLKEVNTAAAAWLFCPDTAIDYPVMRAHDYSYYLNHLPDGTPNKNGSLFIDYNNAPDFSQPLTVIYGHHMKSGKMFGSLKGYKNQGYYEQHPVMYLYTEAGAHRIDLLYGCVIGAKQWREQGFMFAENLPALLDWAAASTTFQSRVAYDGKSRIVALSTCSYEFDSARYVMIEILH